MNGLDYVIAVFAGIVLGVIGLAIYYLVLTFFG